MSRCSFLLRKGNAGSNTAADHIAVAQAALAQLPTRDMTGLTGIDEADLGRQAVSDARRRRRAAPTSS